MSDLRARQQLNKGFGTAFGRGMDLALVPVVFGGIGWGLDSLLGTFPGCIIGFTVFGFAGIIVKMWLGYDQEMRQHEAGAVWTRRSAGEALATTLEASADPAPDAGRFAAEVNAMPEVDQPRRAVDKRRAS